MDSARICSAVWRAGAGKVWSTSVYDEVVNNEVLKDIDGDVLGEGFGKEEATYRRSRAIGALCTTRYWVNQTHARRLWQVVKYRDALLTPLNISSVTIAGCANAPISEVGSIVSQHRL